MGFFCEEKMDMSFAMNYMNYKTHFIGELKRNGLRV